jgi:N-acetylglucosaminyldiphosphoundecaprenol N-acetyl-beta-D-mannosaminyltransferase
VNDRCSVVMGSPVDDVTLGEAVDRIAAMVDVGRATGRVHQVATVNVDFIVNAARDKRLLRLLQGVDLAVPDGMPLVWASRLLGTPLRQRTTGVDMLPALVARSAVAGYRVCLFGAAPGVAVRAATLLREWHPHADITALEAPAIGRDGAMDPAALEPIRQARPDIVGVALGHPKQEWWIARHGAAVGAPVLIGIGGTLDFLTGVTRRAPEWMQRSGLEWLHRAVSEPRRLAGRYATDLTVFGPGLLRQVWTGRRRQGAGVPLMITTRGAEPRLTVDMTGVEALDNLTVADTVSAMRDARRDGSDVRIVGVTPPLIDSARRLGVAGLFERAAFSA